MIFDFATGLINDNLLFVDRETKSIWSQLEGAAVSGELKGQPLTALPSLQTTWGRWKKSHPDTKVMVMPGQQGAEYLYFNPDVGAPRPQYAEFGHNPSQLGLGIALNDESAFFPWRRIRGAKKPIDTEIGGIALRIHVDKPGMTAWAENQSGEMIAAVMTYRKSWLAFYPQSEVYRSGP